MNPSFGAILLFTFTILIASSKRSDFLMTRKASTSVADLLIPWREMYFTERFPECLTLDVLDSKCRHLDTVDQHSPSLPHHTVNEVRSLVEVVGQGERLEIHTRHTQELDAVRAVEGLLGVDHAPAFEVTLSSVEDCGDSHLSENPGKFSSFTCRSVGGRYWPSTEGGCLVPEVNARTDQVRSVGGPPPLASLVPAEVDHVPGHGRVGGPRLVVTSGQDWESDCPFGVDSWAELLLTASPTMWSPASLTPSCSPSSSSSSRCLLVMSSRPDWLAIIT